MFAPVIDAMVAYFVAVLVLVAACGIHRRFIEAAQSAPVAAEAFREGRVLVAAEHEGWQFDNGGEKNGNQL